MLRASILAGLSVLAIVALFSLLPAAAAAGGLALAPFLALAAVIGFRPSSIVQSIQVAPVFSCFFIAFLLWAVAATLWSPNPDHSQAWRLAATAAGGAVFAAVASDARSRRLTRAAGLAAVLILIGLLAVEALGDAPLNRAAQPEAETWQVVRNPARGASVLIVLTWAALAALASAGGAWRIVLGVGLAAAAGVLATQFQITANIAGYGAGLAAFALTLAAPRTGVLLITGALTAWLLLSPWLAPPLAGLDWLDAAPETWAIRVEMWRFAAEKALEAPVLGHGLDASRMFTETIPFRGGSISAISLHPHSASLQIWLETGAIGAGLCAAALISGGLALSKAVAKRRAVAAGAGGALASLGLIANVSYGAWQEWWIAAGFIAAALVAAASTPRQAPH